MKIKELLSSESKWTQGSFAKNTRDENVVAKDPSAVKWCLFGAIDKCYSGTDEFLSITHKTVKEIENITRGHLNSITIFNDFAIFENIKNLVEKLDI